MSQIYNPGDFAMFTKYALILLEHFMTNFANLQKLFCVIAARVSHIVNGHRGCCMSGTSELSPSMTTIMTSLS